jgi:hypothetical protein
MAYVPTQSIIWAHGSGLNVGSANGLRVIKGSGGATIFSDLSSNATEATLSIPTPALLQGKPVTVTAVLLRFISQGAEIDNFALLDNQAAMGIASARGPLTSTDPTKQLRYAVSPGHAVWSGAGVDMILRFSQPGSYIQLIAAGIEFMS